ncbi:MAG: endolytic transglycosylase MltG [candidate division Zixibacteria bacterium]|nr:endolytic transglycosylase MltG [candidate division Zixibacteria bacterium]
MNADKTKFRWWERPLYLVVTLFFVVIGALAAVIGLLAIVWRAIRRVKYRPKRLVIGAALGAVIVIGGFLYIFARPVDLGSRTATLIIKPGDSLAQVAGRLRSDGVIRLRAALVYAGQWIGIDRKLTPGRYDFSGKVSLAGVIRKLRVADFVRVKFTVYEGAPIWKVAGILARALETDSASIVKLNRDSTFLAELGVPYLEGYLFPDTYIVPWGVSPVQVVREMVATFRARTDSLWSSPLPRGMTKEDVLKLASIVQAEIKLDSELTRVSSVYHNRLRLRMHLDADPTVIYGLGGLSRPLDRSDLRKPNPYNTYMRYGLPPTPINSPGLAAILAALHPDTSNYLYFVADGTGGHRFSRTNAEHNTARRDIRRAQRLNRKS